MFSRGASHSEVGELWSELHDLEKRVSDEVSPRIRSLEDERLTRVTQQETSEETERNIENARLSRRHMIYLALCGALSALSTAASIILAIKS